MGEVVRFSGWDGRDMARLKHLAENGDVALDDDAQLEADAAAMGSPDDWAWSAIMYLKGRLEGPLVGTGSVTVSAAAVGLVLGYVERLAGELGIIR